MCMCVHVCLCASTSVCTVHEYGYFFKQCISVCDDNAFFLDYH